MDKNSSALSYPMQNNAFIVLFNYYYPIMLCCHCSIYFWLLKRILSLHKCEQPWSKRDGCRQRVLFTHISNYRLGTQSKNMLGDENITYRVFILLKNLNSEAVADSLKTTTPLSRHSELFNNNSDTVLETQFSTP